MLNSVELDLLLLLAMIYRLLTSLLDIGLESLIINIIHIYYVHKYWFYTCTVILSIDSKYS